MATKGGTTGFILLLMAALGGVGYYAYQLRTTSARAVDDANQARAEAHACTDSLDGEKKGRATSGDQLTNCTAELETQKTNREQTEKLAADMATNLDATKSELEDLRKEHAENDKRLQAFKAVSEKLRKMIDAGKLQVVIRQGRMSVKLPAEILFASGSADLSKEGQGPLAEVAAVLKQFPDRRFMVAGHTDNVPIGPSRYKDNWELSTERAVTVTEFMTSAGMKPHHLVAAGYGEFDPIRSNASEAGRRENRRIEIVLLPNIAEVPQLPADPPAGSTAPAAAKSSK
jgi:chemotaxis protein MotB